MMGLVAYSDSEDDEPVAAPAPKPAAAPRPAAPGPVVLPPPSKRPRKEVNLQALLQRNDAAACLVPPDLDAHSYSGHTCHAARGEQRS